MNKSDSGRSYLVDGQLTLFCNVFMKLRLTHHEPQIGDPNVSPYTIELSLAVKAPYFTNFFKGFGIYKTLNDITGLPKAEEASLNE